MQKELGPIEKKYNVKITCSIEDVPMGTAGPIRLAKDIIMADNDDGLLFVFNSDVICKFPVK